MSRSLAVVLVLVALLAAGGFLGSRFLAGEAPAAAAGGPASVPSSVDRPASPATMEVPGREPEPGPEAPAGGGGQRALAERAAPDRPAPGRAVRVVDLETGAPLPAARLLAVGVDGPVGDHPAWDLDGGDAWLEEHGTPVQLDAEGRGWFDPEGHKRVVLVGSAPGLWGRKSVLGKGKREVELKLGPDVSIPVLVQDPFGSPVAGLPVAVRLRSSTWKNDHRVAPTGPDGRRTIRHVREGLRERDDRRHSIAAVATLLEPVEVPFEPDSPPTGEVVLTVPVTGSLEVRVLPMPGGPPIGAGRVELSVHEPGRDEVPSFWSRVDTVTAELENGLARFEHVALGLEVDVAARGESSTRSTRASGPGPIVAGTPARMELALGSDHPVLRLRVLDSNGAPVPDTTLQVGVTSASVLGPESEHESVDTDGASVLWYDFPRFVAVDAARTLFVQLDAKQGGSGESAEVDLSRGLALGLNDLGDVTLAAARLVASGRLVRADGTPIEDCTVSAQAVHSREDGESWFESLDDVSDSTDGEGRFELPGRVETDRVRLSASCGAWIAEPLEVQVGAAGVVLTALAAGQVRGRVLVDEGIEPTDLRVRLEPADEADRRDSTLRGRADVGKDGSFTIDELKPGTYDLKVTPDRNSDSLARVEGVVVVSGATTSDPRLDPIDLRGLMNCLEVELVPPRPSDAVLGVLQVAYVDNAGEDVSKTHFLNGTTNSLCFPAESIDLTVHVQGFRSATFADQRDDVRVELEPGIRVRLRLAGDTKLPEPPSYLKAFLWAEGSAPAWSLGHFQDQVFGEDREVVVYAGASGKHQVSWLYERRSENSMVTTSLEAEEPEVIEVLDLPGEQDFEVHAPAEALAEHLGGD